MRSPKKSEEVQRSPKKSGEVQRSPKKSGEVQRSPKKSKEVRGSPRKYRKVRKYAYSPLLKTEESECERFEARERTMQCSPVDLLDCSTLDLSVDRLSR